MHCCLIALGSNIGDRADQLTQVYRRFRQLPSIRLMAHSAAIETRPVGFDAGDAFLNAAARVETSLPPAQLLAALLHVETDLGRTRSARWAPRTIDLDLLLYERRTVRTPRLTVPHPAMAFRRFVLEPAAEIAAEMVHPSTGLSVGALRDRLDEKPVYVAITGAPGAGTVALGAAVAARTGAELIAGAGDPAAHAATAGGSAGPAPGSSLEFLEHNLRLVRRDRWSGHRGPLISDFWFDASMAMARNDCAGPERRRLDEAVAGRHPIMQPTLVVVLDAATEILCDRLRDGPSAEAAGLDDARLARMRRQVAVCAARARGQPTLRLSAADLGRAADEAVAAIDAMNSAARSAS